jgi:predicted RNase H-like nuclease (RuvC/YqgF family)
MTILSKFKDKFEDLLINKGPVSCDYDEDIWGIDQAKLEDILFEIDKQVEEERKELESRNGELLTEISNLAKALSHLRDAATDETVSTTDYFKTFDEVESLIAKYKE